MEYADNGMEKKIYCPQFLFNFQFTDKLLFLIGDLKDRLVDARKNC